MTKFELLSNIDLESYCELFGINLNEILSKNQYKDIKPKLGGYIINLQDSNVGNGTHWTALYITKDVAIYYDSFGLPIPTIIVQFIRKFNKNAKILYSIDEIQVLESIFCGWYVLYFLYFFDVLHKRSSKYRYLLNKHNSIFSLKNKQLNDKILRMLIHNII